MEVENKAGNSVCKLDHGETSELFKKWFISEYTGEYVFQNNTGYASQEHVKYGLPNTGGGYDFISFHSGAVTQFFEVKTDGYPYLSKKQKVFARNMSSKGFKCWVFRSHMDQLYLIPALEYRASKLPAEAVVASSG